MLRNSTLQVFVTKTTDEKKLKKELMELDPLFFEKCLLLVDKRISIKRNTGSVVKGDDIHWNITSPNRSLNSTEQNKTANIGMNPTIIYRRYEDAGEKSESKLNNKSLNSINSISSNENSDDSQKLDFDNRKKF